MNLITTVDLRQEFRFFQRTTRGKNAGWEGVEDIAFTTAGAIPVISGKQNTNLSGASIMGIDSHYPIPAAMIRDRKKLYRERLYRRAGAILDDTYATWVFFLRKKARWERPLN